MRNEVESPSEVQPGAPFQTSMASCLACRLPGVGGVGVLPALHFTSSPPSWLPAFVRELLMLILSPAWLLL